MAAPTWETASAGATDAGGVWSYNTTIGSLTSPVLILQIIQDGATASAVALTGSTFINDLAGSAGWTFIGEFSGSSLRQYLWIGRPTSTTDPATASGTNSTSEDLYIRAYSFIDVSTGTTLETVIENTTGGSTTTSTAISATAGDATVVTTGPDRLALNFLGINDDNPFAGFTGESGGTWVTRASYAVASGTDGAIYLIDAAMPSAGTITGGTGSITDSDTWLTVGFALIGTTAAAERVPRTTPYPQLLAQ